MIDKENLLKKLKENLDVLGILLLLIFLFISTVKGSSITTAFTSVEGIPFIQIELQTYIDSYFNWKFTQINNSTWRADFVINPSLWSSAKTCLAQPTTSKLTCFMNLCNNASSFSPNESVRLGLNCSDLTNITKLATDFANMSNYPLTPITSNIQFSNFAIDLNNGNGSFIISFPNGFRVGERAKFGFGTTIINTSTTAWAITQYARRTNSYYASGLFWNWYMNGTNLTYSCSVDGINFVNQTAVRPCNTADCYGADFSVYYNGTYVSYAYSDRSTIATPIYYRRGIPNSNCSITWSTAEQTAVSAISNVYLRYPHVAVDDQGRPWIAYLYVTTTPYTYVYVTKSSTNNGTWATASGFPYEPTTSSNNGWIISVIPLTGGKVLIAWCSDSPTLLYLQSYSGSAWNSVVSSSSTCANGGVYDLVAEGDNAHAVFTTSTPNIRYLNYTYSTNSVSSETVLISGGITTSTAPFLTYNGTGTLYMFYSTISNQVGTINYTTKSQANIWSDRTFWFTLNNLTGTNWYISSYYQNYNNYIGLMAMQNYTPSKFNITFNFLNFTPYTSRKPTLEETDPLYCSIPPLIPLTNVQILCMPKSNVTGQPITGASVTCGAYSQTWGVIQTPSTATEQSNGVYNWTLFSSNLANGNCYIINCSTAISGTTNTFGGTLCVLPAYTTSCASQSDIINSATVILGNMSSNFTTLNDNLYSNFTNTNNLIIYLNNNMSSNFTYLNGRIALVLDNITLVLGNETEVKNLINSLANITAEEIWEYPSRTANCLNCTGENNTYYQNFTTFEGAELTNEQLKNISKYLYVYSAEIKKRENTTVLGYSLPFSMDVLGLGIFFLILCGMISFYISYEYIKRGLK